MIRRRKNNFKREGCGVSASLFYCDIGIKFAQFDEFTRQSHPRTRHRLILENGWYVCQNNICH